MEGENNKVIKAKIQLVTGNVLTGWIHFAENQRVQDMLNDQRAFIPIHILQTDKPEYEITFIAKRHIVSIDFVNDGE